MRTVACFSTAINCVPFRTIWVSTCACATINVFLQYTQGLRRGDVFNLTNRCPPDVSPSLSNHVAQQSYVAVVGNKIVANSMRTVGAARACQFGIRSSKMCTGLELAKVTEVKIFCKLYTIFCPSFLCIGL